MIYKSVKHYEFLVANNLTKTSGLKLFLLVISYFLMFLFSLFYRLISKRINNYNKKNIVYLAWAKVHQCTLDLLSSDENVLSIGGYLGLLRLLSPFNNKVFFDLIFQMRFRDFFSLKKMSSFFELYIISSWITHNGFRYIYISGHYDRFTYNLSLCCRIYAVKLIIAQHGVVSMVSIPNKIVVEKVLLKYEISRNYFNNFIECGDYIYREELDFDKIRISKGLCVKNPSSILFIGQVNHVEKTLSVLKLLKKFSNADIYYLAHPLDRSNVYSSYVKVVDEPIVNPSLVVSLYSSLAYSYHLLNYNVVFIPEYIDVDFFNDPSVIKIYRTDDLLQFLG